MRGVGCSSSCNPGPRRERGVQAARRILRGWVRAQPKASHGPADCPCRRAEGLALKENWPRLRPENVRLGMEAGRPKPLAGSVHDSPACLLPGARSLRAM